MTTEKQALATSFSLAQMEVQQLTTELTTSQTATTTSKTSLQEQLAAALADTRKPQSLQDQIAVATMANGAHQAQVDFLSVKVQTLEDDVQTLTTEKQVAQMKVQDP